MGLDLILQSVVNALATGMFYAVLAVGLTLIFGVMRIIQFAHGYVYVFGAYAMVILVDSYHLPYFVALLLAAMIVGLASIVMERVFFKPFRGEERAMESLIVSFGLALVLEGSALVAFGPKERFLDSPVTGVFNMFGIVLSGSRLVILIGSLVSVGALLAFLRWTRQGQAMRAVAQDPVAAALQGVNVDRIYSSGFAIGSALAAVGAALILPISFVAPSVGSSMALTAFVVVILGGLGSVVGALAGGLTLGFVQTFGFLLFGVGSTLLGFLTIMVILLLRPQGLLGHE